MTNYNFNLKRDYRPYDNPAKARRKKLLQAIRKRRAQLLEKLKMA